jgi:hypothetical protein
MRLVHHALAHMCELVDRGGNYEKTSSVCLRDRKYDSENVATRRPAAARFDIITVTPGPTLPMPDSADRM